MKVGVVLPAAEVDGAGTTPPWETVRAFAMRAEEQGLDSVWMFDHLFHRWDSRIEGMHEAWTIVSAVAAVTKKVEIGTLVLCTSFRSPGLIAKMAATANEVSGARLILGLGAGWHDPEYDAFGYPKDHRASRFEEAAQIIVPLLRGETVTIEGRYYQAREAVLAPPPPSPTPIMIAAFGRRMLRLTARLADIWNSAWYGAPNDKLEQRLGQLDEALTAEGRDPGGVIRTIGMSVRDPDQAPRGDEKDFAGSIDELTAALDDYEAMGIGHVIGLLQPPNLRSLDRLAQAAGARRKA
jgi:alkanesulfonate monooxygenase SsuD/methylene tetrahydromethanopterin reductase-like flavin-dependent oxidoreductase (luciferase family)